MAHLGRLHPDAKKALVEFRHNAFFKCLDKWSNLVSVPKDRLSVIYTGSTAMKTSHGTLIPWNQAY